MGIMQYKEEVREVIKENPLVFGDFQVKQKEKDKCLGDWFHSKSLAEGVETTIKAREGPPLTCGMWPSSLACSTSVVLGPT